MYNSHILQEHFFMISFTDFSVTVLDSIHHLRYSKTIIIELN
jgi:hypothetical protein